MNNARPSEITTLLNPAFCAILLYVGISEFHKIQGKGVSYIFPFLFLPLILHKDTREKLPRSSNTTLSSWLTNPCTAIVKVGFATRAQSMSPYTKESLLFAAMHEVLEINEDGMLYPLTELKLKSYISKATPDLLSCIKSAKLCGKLIARAGDMKTVMSLLGVKP